MKEINRRNVLKISGASLAAASSLSTGSATEGLPVGRVSGTSRNPVTREQMNRMKNRIFRIARQKNDLQKSGYHDAFPGFAGDGEIVDYVAMFDSEGRLKHHVEAVGSETPADRVRARATKVEQKYRHRAANGKR